MFHYHNDEYASGVIRYTVWFVHTRVYPKVSELAAWSQNAKGTALCH
jgi:hypothetical protein